jgi:hypothetical protein
MAELMYANINDGDDFNAMVDSRPTGVLVQVGSYSQKSQRGAAHMLRKAQVQELIDALTVALNDL